MDCIINSCDNPGEASLGVRLRRPDTTAIWSPNTGATLCKYHAEHGMRIIILLEPTHTGEVETSVSQLGTRLDRSTPIKYSKS